MAELSAKFRWSHPHPTHYSNKELVKLQNNAYVRLYRRKPLFAPFLEDRLVNVTKTLTSFDKRRQLLALAPCTDMVCLFVTPGHDVSWSHKTALWEMVISEGQIVPAADRVARSSQDWNVALEVRSDKRH